MMNPSKSGGAQLAQAAANTFLFPIDRLPVPKVPLGNLIKAARDTLCAKAQAIGVKLFICDDWEALERINSRNLDSWVPILHRNSTFPSFWVAAVANGEIVGTQAALLVDCCQRSYGERLQDLSLFYDCPNDIPEGEHCFVGGYSPAFETHGLVAWLAAGWNHPSQRGRGLFHIVGRAVRVEAAARWNPSWWAGVVTPDVVPMWSRQRAGRRHLDERPTILYLQREVARPPLHFMRISRTAQILDMQELVGEVIA